MFFASKNLMGEEKKPEEAKKPEEPKKPEEVKEAEEKKSKESKAATETPPPPPPPQEIILKVYMHCEACARKVRRCLRGFEGVEDVITDCKTSKVVVKGEKADPLKVLARVQRKSHRQVELLSPIPPPQPPAEEPKKEEKEVVKEEKKEPPKVTVVLKVYMHCEACSQEIRKRIQRMEGVESAEPELKSSQVTVKGVFEPENLVNHVNKRTGKKAVIMKVEVEKKEEEKSKEKKPEEGKKEAETGKEGGKENKEAAADSSSATEPLPTKPEAEPEEDPKLDMKKNEFYYYQPHPNFQVYPQMFVQDLYAHPPQMFSDENPNACFVM